MSANDIKALWCLDARDAGAVLEKRYGGEVELDKAIRGCFKTTTRPSLSHFLLASLPITEAATTNYDTLFEQAWRAATGDAPAVLPGGHASSTRRWLLKLHGDLANRERALVLSREQYLRFEQTAGAIAAVLQAMLLTRHLLITGYSLTDETFHRIAYEVRQIAQVPETSAVASSSRDAHEANRLGTAILVEPPGLVHEVWKDDLVLVPLRIDREDLSAASRRQEILLDLIGHLAAPAERYLLAPGWQQLTEREPDKSLFDALKAVEDIVARRQLTGPLEEAARRVLDQFGSTVSPQEAVRSARLSRRHPRPYR
jgi:hypothetical protein